MGLTGVTVANLLQLGKPWPFPSFCGKMTEILNLQGAQMLYKTRSPLKTYIIFLLLVFVVQGLGNWVTMGNIQEWYPGLRKAAWNPPNAVFGPVWTILYVMIAISGARFWQALTGTAKDKLRHPVMRLYAVQLFLNCWWSFLFFGMHKPLIALVDMVLLLAAIIVLILRGRSVDRVGAWLLVPYALWVAFAISLNTAIAVMN